MTIRRSLWANSDIPSKIIPYLDRKEKQQAAQVCQVFRTAVFDTGIHPGAGIIPTCTALDIGPHLPYVTCIAKLPASAEGSSDLIYPPTYSPRGNLLASASLRGEIQIWDLAGQKLHLSIPGLTSPPTKMKFNSPKNELIVAYKNGSLYRHSLQEPYTQQEIDHSFGKIENIEISSNGKELVARYTSQKVYHLNSEPPTELVSKHSNWSTCIKISPDSNRLLVGHASGHTDLWDLIENKLIHTIKRKLYSVHCVGVGEKANIFAIGYHPIMQSGGIVELWDIDKPSPLYTLELDEDKPMDLHISPDGTKVLIGSGNGTIHFLTSDGSKISFQGPTCGIESLTPNQDWTSLTTLSRDNSVQVWDLIEGERRKEFQAPLETSVTVGSTGDQLVVKKMNGSIDIYSCEPFAEEISHKGTPLPANLAFLEMTEWLIQANKASCSLKTYEQTIFPKIMQRIRRLPSEIRQKFFDLVTHGTFTEPSIQFFFTKLDAMDKETKKKFKDQLAANFGIE